MALLEDDIIEFPLYPIALSCCKHALRLCICCSPLSNVLPADFTIGSTSDKHEGEGKYPERRRLCKEPEFTTTSQLNILGRFCREISETIDSISSTDSCGALPSSSLVMLFRNPLRIRNTSGSVGSGEQGLSSPPRLRTGSRVRGRLLCA